MEREMRIDDRPSGAEVAALKAKLEALAAAPAVRDHLAALENAEARQRAELLGAIEAAERARDASAAARGPRISAARAAVERARAALALAEVELRRLEREQLDADAGADAALTRAEVGLRPLGGDEADALARALLFEVRAAEGARAWRVVEHRSAFGSRIETTEATDGEAIARRGLLEARLREAESLRRARLSPAEVRARCAAIRRELRLDAE
jgi:hypothetical protein